jgi:hypothetical protein
MAALGHTKTNYTLIETFNCLEDIFGIANEIVNNNYGNECHFKDLLRP